MKSLRSFQEIVVFDVETTGLDASRDRVIELGCCKYEWKEDKLVLTDEMDVLINIDFALPNKIVELTGITDQQLHTEGLSEADVVQAFFQRFIHSGQHSKRLFAAYNANFDIFFIEAMLNRHQKQIPKTIDFLDVLTVFKDRAPYPHRLEHAIRFYQLEDVSNSHRALDDVKATFSVLERMGHELDDLSQYVNRFGYNPKYPSFKRYPKINYYPQPYGSKIKLYQR